MRRAVCCLGVGAPALKQCAKKGNPVGFPFERIAGLSAHEAWGCPYWLHARGGQFDQGCPVARNDGLYAHEADGVDGARERRLLTKQCARNGTCIGFFPSTLQDIELVPGWETWLTGG